MSIRFASPAAEEPSSKRAKEQPVPSSTVISKSEGALRTFCNYGLLTQSECRSWIGQFFPEVLPAQIILKCTNLVQTVFRRIEQVLEKSRVSEPLPQRATYAVDDLDLVAQQATKMYAECITSQLTECAMGSLETGHLAPHSTAFAFPLSMQAKKEHIDADPANMLAIVANFAAARPALFHSSDMKGLLGLIVDRLWDQIPYINHRNYRAIQKAFKTLSEHQLILKLPSLELEASAEAMFEGAKNHLRALIGVDLKTHVIDANETPDFRARPCSWVVRSKDQRKPPFATELLLDWLPSWTGTGFFEDLETQKLILEAFEKAWQQDTEVYCGARYLKDLWGQWEIWWKKEMHVKLPNKQAFLLIFENGSLPLNPAEIHLLSVALPVLRAQIEGNFLESSDRQSKIEDLSLEDFQAFYQCIFANAGINGTLDQRIVLLRVAQRFQHPFIVNNVLEGIIRDISVQPNAKGLAGMVELFSLERKLAWRQCLSPEIGHLLQPLRQQFINVSILPHLDFPGLISFLKTNFEHAQNLEMPCFHLQTLQLHAEYFNHPSYNRDLLIEGLKLYKDSLKDLKIDSIRGFALLEGFHPTKLTALTFEDVKEQSWDSCAQVLPVFPLLPSLSRITLTNCSDLKMWMKEVVKAPALKAITISLHQITGLTTALSLIPRDKSVEISLPMPIQGIITIEDAFWNVAFSFSSFKISVCNGIKHRGQVFNKLHHANGKLTVDGLRLPTTIESLQKVFPNNTIVQGRL